MELILAYSPGINRFVDENDVIVHDISALIPQWQTNNWLNDGAKDLIVKTKNGWNALLVCLNDEEEDSLFDYWGFQESFGLKVDRQKY